MNEAVLYIFDHKFSVNRRLAGILNAAKKHGWFIERIEARDNPTSLADMVKAFNAQGAIVENALHDPKPYEPARFARLHVPVVYCEDSHNEYHGRRTSVRHDSRVAAQKAVRALLDLNLPDYAFVGYRQTRNWSEIRKRTFRTLIRAADKNAHVFDPARPTPCQDMADFLLRLSGFLLSLPRPCGIFAANDETADYVLRMAKRNGILVPDEMPVIGIDNDELRCENTQPTLTSVAPDFQRSGEIAVELLAERMADAKVPYKTVTYGASDVMRRHSFFKYARRDDQIIKSLEYIRLNACAGIRVDDVVATTTLSRRTFEMRFKSMSGQSVQAEIDNVRISTAKTLLKDPCQSIESIAHQCGYAGESSLLHTFRKITGMTPARWRHAQDLRQRQ